MKKQKEKKAEILQNERSCLEMFPSFVSGLSSPIQRNRNKSKLNPF